MKRLKHPEHGWHFPFSAAEEARMRANGWVDDEPEQTHAVEKPGQVEEVKQKRGPGRPKKTQ